MDDRAIVERRIGMGLQKLTPALCKALGIPEETKGLVVSDLFPENEYRTEEQGWRENIGRGDILLAVDGEWLNNLAELATLLRGKRSGQLLTADFAALDMARRYVRYKARLILK